MRTQYPPIIHIMSIHTHIHTHTCIYTEMYVLAYNLYYSVCKVGTVPLHFFFPVDVLQSSGKIHFTAIHTRADVQEHKFFFFFIAKM